MSRRCLATFQYQGEASKLRVRRAGTIAVKNPVAANLGVMSLDFNLIINLDRRLKNISNSD